MSSSSNAKDIIKTLNMQPHPEGGYFVETFRDSNTYTTSNGKTRSHSTCIYYLLEGGDRSHWHKVDAVEVWHYYAGAPLKLSLWEGKKEEGGSKEDVRVITLGGDVLKGERPQGVVKKDEWQSAESTGEWTLVGCTVAPAFEIEGFEMAEQGWAPGSKGKA